MIRPTANWQIFPVPTIGGEVFRVSSTYNRRPYYRLRAYVSSLYFNSDEFERWTTIYPNKESSILELPIPKVFQLDGVIVRFLAIQLASPPYHGSWLHDWDVELSEYIPEGGASEVLPEFGPLLEGQQAAIERLTELIKNQPPEPITADFGPGGIRPRD